MDSEENENDKINIDDAPLSPVLCDSQANKKIYKQRMRMKSRVKLLHRFVPESSGSKDKLQEDKPLLEVEEESFILSQAENIFKSIEIFEKIEDEQCKIPETVSPSPQLQKLEVFEFKKPESPPVHSKKLKSSGKQTEFQGFQTAGGRNIALSSETIEKSKNLFDDILNPVETSDSGRCNKYSFLSKPSIKKSPEFEHSYAKKLEDVPKVVNHNSSLDEKLKNDNCKESVDYHKSNAENTDFGGFKKASGKEIKVTESALATAKSMFNKEFMNNSKFSHNSNTFESSKKNSIGGFTKASGKEIKLTKSTLEIAKKIFGDDLFSLEHENSTEDADLLSSQETNTLFNNLTVIENKALEENNHLSQFSSNFSKKDFEKSSDFKGFTESLIEDSKKRADDFVTFLMKYSEKQRKSNKRQLPDFSNSKNQKRFKPTPVLETRNQGFSSASGNVIKVSKSSLAKAQEIFKEINLNNEVSGYTNSKSVDNASESPSLKSFDTKTNNKNITSGFKTASGTSCKLSEEALKQAEHLFKSEEIFKEINLNNEVSQCTRTNNKNITSGFKTASGTSCKLSEEALKQAEHLYKNEEIFKDTNLNKEVFHYTNSKSVEDASESTSLKSVDARTKNKNTSKNITSGFKTASGTSCKLSEDALKQAKHLLDSEEIFKEINLNKEVSQCTNSKSVDNSSQFLGTRTNNIASGFNTASGNSCKLSEEALKQAEHLFENVKNESPSSSSSLANLSFDQTSRKTHDFTLNKSQKPQRKKRLGMSTCRNRFEISKDKLERAKLLFEDEKPVGSPIRIKEQPTIYNSTPVKSHAQEEISIDADITPIKKVSINTSREKSDCVIDGDVIIKACTKGNIDTWCDDLENERKRLELKLKMIVERQEILNLQKSLLNSNCQERRKKRTGVLFGKKQSASDRISLKFCKLGSSNKYASVNPQNAELVHFTSEGQCTPSVVTKDGAIVIPNARNMIGLSEIEIAFKVMPGIEPKLIPNGWIRNHFKWIIWKLASYERFTTNLSDCLNVENVIQQLKYRYDREIDRAERPTLRKIFEKDDVPQKRMVLCVSQIFHLENDNFELELTDGWYSIRTVIDEPLRSQIYKQKIQIGTKLVICGAELQNCDGCHPLEATDMVRLKIVCNSTRRAVWYAKLGYQKFLEPFPLRLRSLYPNGGLVGCVKVCIARVYPVKYLEKQNNLTVWRNRKAEEMRAQDWENERLKRVEEVREVVRRDYERSMQSSEKNVSTSVNKIDIENIRCPRTLYNLYQASRDPESLQERLSHSQRVAIMDYQQQLSFRQQEEMRVRMQESIDQLQISKRNVTPVLQLILIDVLDPEEKTCTFHIWRPSETHLQLLTESSVFYVYNVLPKKNGDLTSTTHTKFEPVKEEFPQFQKYKRTLFPIALTNNSVNKPIFGEYDTVGIIVQISINNFNQCFWLADTNERLLFVRVFEGPKNCQLLDNFKCGQVVAVANLKFCDSSFEFGEAIANHATVISCYPQYKHLQEGINVLNKHLPKDISSFIERCTQKLTYYVDKVNMLKNYSSNANQSNSLNSVNVPDDSFEESTLVDSRLTSTDVALSLIDIDKLI